jgi:CRP-like cAMP-binding protein
LAEPKNLLLELLPRKDREHILAQAKAVDLKLEEVVWLQGKPARFVYFPVTSFISMVASIDGEPVLEVGMAGREGVLGAQLALGMTAAPVHAVVQGSGTAWRLSAAAFQSEVQDSVPLRTLIDNYLSVLMHQISTAAACVHFHSIGQRLARWLLMTQDRANADTFHVTHQFLSYMLGVRRVGVTAAAGALQSKGHITYSRGSVTVLNREGLESASCSCYAADLKAYDAAMR